MKTDTPSADKDGIRIASARDANVSDSAIAAFYAAHWARPIALSRADFSTWQFNKGPASGGDNHSIVALENGAIIAVMGVTPNVFMMDGKPRNGAELTTWVVAPQARGKGIGSKILAALQDRYDVLVGAGITGGAMPLYLRAGFTSLKYIPRFFHISDFDKITTFVDASERALQLTAKRQDDAPAARWNAKSVAAADLAPMANAMESSGHFARDADRLAWRYDDHPAFRYHAFEIHDADDPGLGAGLVMRKDEVNETAFHHILDLFGDPKDIPAAFAFAEHEARDQGAAFVDISLTLGGTIAALRTRNWSSVVDDTLIEIPSLFYPLELRTPATTSMVIWARDDKHSLFDLSRVHVTRGDMDLDRPTLAWYEGNSA